MFQAKIRTNKDSLVVVIGGASYTVDKNHRNYNKLNELFVANDSAGFVELFNIPQHETSEEFIKASAPVEEFRFEGNNIFMNGEQLHGVIVDRINAMRESGENFQYMLNFLRNINNNTSSRAKMEAYDFIANKNIPITEDGCILAYKAVDKNFYSKRSGKLKLIKGSTMDGKIYNAVGEEIECDRSNVDDDRQNECSYGLHAGGLSYSGPGGAYHSHGDKIVIVKINPADIVSVPKDYNATKMRVCKYTVISEYVRPLSSVVENSHDDDIDYDEEDDWDEEEYEEEDYSDEDDWEDEEEEEDDDDEVWTRKLTDINEPMSVLYNGKIRSVVFKEEFDDHFIVQLSEFDHKYEDDSENLRHFKKEKCQIL